MPQFFFNFSGRDRDVMGENCATLDDARNSAIRLLGAYLADHPGYADEGHWRVQVEDDLRRPLLTVIVAAVPKRRAPA